MVTVDDGDLIAVVDSGCDGDPDAWCWWSDEYPEEGSIGPFPTREEAVADAATYGYTVPAGAG